MQLICVVQNEYGRAQADYRDGVGVGVGGVGGEGEVESRWGRKKGVIETDA